MKIRVYETFVSTFVLVLLLAQAATLIPTALQTGRVGARYWPILIYGMYATANYEGETIDVHYLIEGETEAGRTIDITAEMLGTSRFHFVQLGKGLASGSQDTLQDFLSLYRFDKLVRLRIKTYPLKLAREGGVPIPSKVIKEIELPR